MDSCANHNKPCSSSPTFKPSTPSKLSKSQAQIARKRAKDRESQRAARAKTKLHIQALENELALLRSRSDDRAVRRLLDHNAFLQVEIARIRATAGVGGASAAACFPREQGAVPVPVPVPTPAPAHGYCLDKAGYRGDVSVFDVAGDGAADHGWGDGGKVMAPSGLGLPVLGPECQAGGPDLHIGWTDVWADGHVFGAGLPPEYCYYGDTRMSIALQPELM
ncbi:uncharacterized protein UV8b_05996 [Ustilaginoidea virens]|uniref:BZIP domain-containing protein n=1 Tax=Ustilaginoidea virens TaxID=1159556 RepID=A0A8E5MIN8_USTVR|nr:uncharacterized protein UV8b_05996 [Ustilaginoidea virens]QUC21753.1 hypothetical protein UV8b_05996 [Ustilaginoidea virens]